MDRLDEMFKIQSEQDSKWTDFNRINVDPNYRLSFIKQRVLDMIDQSVKLLNEFDWKSHVLDKKEHLYDAQEQLIDVQKYLIGFAISLGMTPNDWIDMFKNKSTILDTRWSQKELSLNKRVNVAVLDIDGVIMNYDEAYSKFLESKGLKRTIYHRTSYSFHSIYGISKEQDEDYYDEFISSGGLLNCEPYDYIYGVINYLKSSNVIIALVTARPSWKYKRVIIDTILSLKKHGIEYNLIYSDKDKADVIINKIYPANVICVVEDRDKHAIEVSHLGIKTFLINKSYNKGLTNTSNLIRIEESELLNQIKEII
jgi:uncharacterized HAD superfamily protein